MFSSIIKQLLVSQRNITPRSLIYANFCSEKSFLTKLPILEKHSLDFSEHKAKMKEKNYRDWNKEELIENIKRLEASILILRTVINKQNSGDTEDSLRKSNLQKYKKRRIALKLLYFGWDYQGLVADNGITIKNTIQEYLRTAMIKARLIECWKECNPDWCGRTDKTVSSFSQVLALDVKTNLLEGQGVFEAENFESPCKDRKITTTEINYSKIINHYLPNDIKVLGWAPVDKDYNPRFKTINRTYTYYHEKECLNIEAMLKAMHLLEGEHDFRNFSKFSLVNYITTFRRKIYSATITPFPSSDLLNSDYDLIVFKFVGSSFLRHQIRNIMSVLLTVGRDLESPDIITELLDVNKHPCKPDYVAATGIPLVLQQIDFHNLNWEYNSEAIYKVARNIRELWSTYAIKAAIIRDSIEEINKIAQKSVNIEMEQKPKPKYKSILERTKLESIEQRINNYKKKKDILIL